MRVRLSCRMRDLDEGRSSPAGKRSQQEKRKSPHLLIRQVNGTAVDLGDTSASGDSSTHNDDFREMHARGHAMEGSFCASDASFLSNLHYQKQLSVSRF